MSPKELNYIEDALGHEQFLKTQCQEAIQNLQDPTLKNQVQQMTQKHQQIFDLLLTTKGVCDLYMHGTIEASTANVHQTFNQALNDSLCMQDDIYKEMSAKGWYQMEQAEQQKIMKVKNQFAGM